MGHNKTEPATDATEKHGTAATVATPTASDESRQFVTLTSLLIVVVIAMAITLAMVYAAAGKGWLTLGNSGPKVVTLDVDRLIEAGLKANERKGLSADPKADVDLFQANLKKEVDRLASDGNLVINFHAVIAGSQQNDVTDEVIAHLGIGDKGSAK